MSCPHREPIQGTKTTEHISVLFCLFVLVRLVLALVVALSENHVSDRDSDVREV